MLRLFLVSFKDVSLSADLLLSAPPTSSSSPLVERLRPTLTGKGNFL